MLGKTIAWVGTAAWAFVGWFYVFHYVGLVRFSDYEPAQVGEFFIGFFAPLAFFWVIVGYFQQGATLARHAKILERQIAELRRTLSVAEQRTPGGPVAPQAAAETAPVPVAPTLAPAPAPTPAADAPMPMLPTPYDMFYWAADLTIRELNAIASDIVRVAGTEELLDRSLRYFGAGHKDIYFQVMIKSFANQDMEKILSMMRRTQGFPDNVSTYLQKYDALVEEANGFDPDGYLSSHLIYSPMGQVADIFRDIEYAHFGEDGNNTNER